MGFVSAKVSDVADIREFECALPDDVQLSAVANRLAELAKFPICGQDGYPLHYVFIAKGGGHALNPQSCLRDLHAHKPLELRLVPEFSASGEQDAAREEHGDETASSLVRVEHECALLHDDGLDLQPDVRIDAQVHREIEQFAMQDRYTECAGLLLGDVSVENRERVVHIRACAPAAEAEGDRLSVRITARAWESALRIKDKEYPELRTLGWFHTHPGSGVFMSDSDTFAHKHFFPHPNMVAYVLDPTTGRDGFFYWHNGVIGLRPSYGLVCTVKKGGWWERLRPGPKAIRTAVIALALIGVIYLGVTRPGHKPPEPKKTVHVSVKAAPPVKTEARDAVYTLGPRDSFWLICNRHYNDGELAKALARYNGIRDLSRLQVGQQIKLPPKDKLKRLAGR
jgi:proteasome lid subunit RPN8/RPN11